MQALGYRRFRLSGLMGLAHRSRSKVTIHAPHICMDEMTEDEDDIEWPTESIDQPILHRQLMRKLERTVSQERIKHCKEVMAHFSLPKEKIAVRCVTGLGAKHPIALIFRITEHPVPHNVLRGINECPWVKSCYVAISERVCQFKVVVR